MLSISLVDVVVGDLVFDTVSEAAERVGDTGAGTGRVLAGLFLADDAVMGTLTINSVRVASIAVRTDKLILKVSTSDLSELLKVFKTLVRRTTFAGTRSARKAQVIVVSTASCQVHRREDLD